MGIENLFHGFQIAVTPFNLFVAVLGITLARSSASCGIGAPNGVAILLPLTFTAAHSAYLLTSLYWGRLRGRDHVGALQHPGRAVVVATTFAGFPWRGKEGRPGATPAFTSSFIGALFSIVLITSSAPLLAEVALKFGPPESSRSSS